MEKKDIVAILKKPTWEVGEKVHAVHRVPYSSNPTVEFDMEIQYENAPYCPEVPWRIDGKVLFNGVWKGGQCGHRYPTLEAALVDIINNFNNNVNIRNHYKKIEDYF